MKVGVAGGSLEGGRAPDRGRNRIRASQPASKFGLGAVSEQQTVSRGNTANTKGRLPSSGAFRSAHRKEDRMEVVHPRCCGIDVHKASVCACISIKDNQKSGKQKQRFETTTAGLRELATWLREWKVTTVAMEATGVYWKPVWNILEEEFELLL